MNPRYVSAAIAIPLFLAVILLGNQYVIAVFLMAIGAVAAFEWARLIKMPRDITFIYCLAELLMIGCLSWVFIHVNQFPYFVDFADILVLLMSFYWLVLTPIILFNAKLQHNIWQNKKLLKLLGLFILMAFSWSLLHLWQLLGGIGICSIFALIWVSDGAAYFVGQKFGRNKLCLKISPNKTWEGAIAGALFCLFVMIVFIYYFQDVMPLWSLIILGVLTAIYAPLGDLFESFMKRQAQVKDSGRLMPGHGGILDRIDSWLPVVTIWGGAIYLLNY